MSELNPSLAEKVGEERDLIPVEISTRFLEHFSEQLYSSPQKAFEELISNGWDAGATLVDIQIADDLQSSDATMCVLDNGASMDAQGLRELWHIAFSPKRDQPLQHGRHVVGKFGIGKLATYVLASKLTYICKASDGVIRRVTMDYGVVDRNADADKLISELELKLFEVSQDEVKAVLDEVHGGAGIWKRIVDGVKPIGLPAIEQPEFTQPLATSDQPERNTWTLVILSGLKPTGRELKVGVLKRMLGAALPFSSEMAILINGERISSSKLNAPIAKEWEIGPDLKITSFEVPNGTSADADEQVDEDDTTGDGSSGGAHTIQVTSGKTPQPYIDIPGIGRVTGRVQLFVDKITGGKSDSRGASNGFHVNVLGRVVNQNDPTFGAENLSHAAWARFRMAVRVDGLNAFLNTNREQFREQNELKIFRAFLRKVFNVARSHYDSDKNAEMPDGGDVLVKSLGVLSLAPLRSAVSEALRTQPQIPGLFDDRGITDREQKREDWRANTAENIRSALGQVKYEKVDDDSFVKFRISDSTIVVNRDHPFVTEHSRSRAEKELMRTVAMVSLLSDVYALELGVEPSQLEAIREYRDQLMRYRALQRRKSGMHIAKLLLSTQHKSSQPKQLEKVLSDALTYLGFTVRELAQSGEPEGVAQAFPTPSTRMPTEDDPEPPLYSFTYDAKTSKYETASTGNCSLDAVNEHRERYKAPYALLVAPGFEEGALATRCDQLNITPMKASDLGRLLEYTVEYGAIPLDVFETLFTLHDPHATEKWVTDLEGSLQKNRRLTIDIFLRALDLLKGQVPDVLQASLIAHTCRRDLGVKTVVDTDVVKLVRGLQILVPDLVGIDDNDRIVINASSKRVAAAVEAQLEKLHDESDMEEG